MKTGRLRVADRELAFDVTRPGDGPCFVFLHGLASERRGEKSRGLEAELARRGWGFARVDTTGHGESSGELRDLTLSRQLEDGAAFLAHLREAEGWRRPPVLVGSSLGGLTAAWLAAERPAEVAAAVLLAPGFRFIETIIRRLGHEAIERWRLTGETLLTSPWISTPMSWRLAEDWATHAHDELPGRLTVPAIVLHGTEDEIVAIDDSRRFARAAGANVALVEIEGGDHRLTSDLPRLLRETVAFVEREGLA